MTRASACRIAAFALLIGSASRPVRADAEGAKDAALYDCGTLALHTLLHLEGHPIRLSDLESRLPPPPASGHSMARLRDAAQSAGLRLIGVKLPPDRSAIDRPALVFLKRGRHGHFLVIRPVGHTGRLVQVIDSAGWPRVLDADELYSSPEWTGLALVPSRSNWAIRIAALSAGVGAIGFGLCILSRLRRQRMAGIQPA